MTSPLLGPFPDLTHNTHASMLACGLASNLLAANNSDSLPVAPKATLSSSQVITRVFIDLGDSDDDGGVQEVVLVQEGIAALVF